MSKAGFLEGSECVHHTSVRIGVINSWGIVVHLDIQIKAAAGLQRQLTCSQIFY